MLRILFFGHLRLGFLCERSTSFVSVVVALKFHVGCWYRKVVVLGLSSEFVVLRLIPNVPPTERVANFKTAM